MNNEKKIISIFKTFVQKTLIPQIRKVEGSLQEWYTFSSMLNLQYPNLNQIQTFVDRLPDQSSLAPLQKKRSDTSGKKKDQPQYLFAQQSDKSSKNGFNPNKSFGGDRNKNPLGFNRGFQAQEPKEIKTEIKEGSYVKDEQFKKITLNTMPNISKSSSSNSIISSLNRVYLNLLENQKKLESLAPSIAQNRT